MKTWKKKKHHNLPQHRRKLKNSFPVFSKSGTTFSKKDPTWQTGQYKLNLTGFEVPWFEPSSIVNFPTITHAKITSKPLYHRHKKQWHFKAKIL